MGLELLRHYNIISFEEIDSTNEEAKRLARAGVSGNFLIISKRQTAGVGRRMRQWKAPDGNLNLSLMLQTSTPLDKLYNIVFIAGIALLDSIKDLYNNSFNSDANNKKKQNDSADRLLQLKWPNDLLINGKKAAGILIESLNIKGQSFIIIGVGVNVLDYPLIEGKKLCSLSSELGLHCAAKEIAEAFTHKFDKYYIEWKKTDDFAKIKSYWLEHAYMLGEKVVIDPKAGSTSSSFKEISNSNHSAEDGLKLKTDKKSPKKSPPSPALSNDKYLVSGIFIGIDDTGSIIIKNEEGENITLNFGEVI